MPMSPFHKKTSVKAEVMIKLKNFDCLPKLEKLSKLENS
jgi:hypothetical protein